MKKIATITPISCCAPGSPPLKGKQLDALAGQFKALSDPTRLSIVNSLANREECCVCEFQHLGLSQPTISHHLKVLREAGLVEVARKRGTWTFYRLGAGRGAVPRLRPRRLGQARAGAGHGRGVCRALSDRARRCDGVELVRVVEDGRLGGARGA